MAEITAVEDPSPLKYRTFVQPYKDFPPILSHVSPFAVVVKAMRILEFVVKRSKRTGQTKKQELEEEILQQPQWSKVSYEVGTILRKVLEATLPPDEAEMLTAAFMNVANAIANLETRFAERAAVFMDDDDSEPGSIRPRTVSHPSQYSTRSNPGPASPTKASGSGGKLRGNNTGTSRAGGFNAVLSLALVRFRNGAQASSSSIHTPAALIAHEWQQEHSSTHSSPNLSIRHLPKVFSSVRNGARKGVGFVKGKVLKKVLGSVGKSTVPVRLRAVRGGSRNTSKSVTY